MRGVAEEECCVLRGWKSVTGSKGRGGCLKGWLIVWWGEEEGYLYGGCECVGL